MSIITIPSEIQMQILYQLSCKDLSNAARSCKALLHQFTDNDHFWMLLLQRDFPSKNKLSSRNFEPIHQPSYRFYFCKNQIESYIKKELQNVYRTPNVIEFKQISDCPLFKKITKFFNDNCSTEAIIIYCRAYESTFQFMRRENERIRNHQIHTHQIANPGPDSISPTLQSSGISDYIKYILENAPDRDRASLELRIKLLCDRSYGLLSDSPISDPESSFEYLTNLENEDPSKTVQAELIKCYVSNCICGVALNHSMEKRLFGLKSIALQGNHEAQWHLGQAHYHKKLGKDIIDQEIECNLTDLEAEFHFRIVQITKEIPSAFSALNDVEVALFEKLKELATAGDEHALRLLRDIYVNLKYINFEFTVDKRVEALKELNSRNSIFINSAIADIYILDLKELLGVWQGRKQQQDQPIITKIRERHSQLEQIVLKEKEPKAMEILAKLYHKETQLLGLTLEESINKIRLLANLGCNEAKNILISQLVNTQRSISRQTNSHLNRVTEDRIIEQCIDSNDLKIVEQHSYLVKTFENRPIALFYFNIKSKLADLTLG